MASGKYMKPCKINLESFPVNLYEKSLSFDLSSCGHFASCSFNRQALTSHSIAYNYLITGFDWSNSERLLRFVGKELIERTTLRILECKCWKALFFKCRGSTTALSQSLLISGKNSCLEFLIAINFVILALLVIFVALLDSFFLNWATFLVTVHVSLSSYLHGFHLQVEDIPDFALSEVMSECQTLAKLEKYVAALLSSPLKNSINFISEGTSSNEKLTWISRTWSIQFSKCQLTSCLVNNSTTLWSSLQLTPYKWKIIIWTSYTWTSIQKTYQPRGWLIPFPKRCTIPSNSNLKWTFILPKPYKFITFLPEIIHLNVKFA